MTLLLAASLAGTPGLFDYDTEAPLAIEEQTARVGWSGS